MAEPILIVFGIVAGAVALWSWGRPRADIVAVLVVLALMLSRVLTPKEISLAVLRGTRGSESVSSRTQDATPMPTKTVLCSAGLSHLLLYPNGDVYRCMADYNARRAPLFSATQGWKTIDAPFECPHETCYAACDLDWTKKWVFEEGNPVPEIMQPQEYLVNPRDGRFWADQTLATPLTNVAHIVWAPTLLCDYDCRYCGCAVGAHDVRKDFPSASPELGVEEWIRVWEEILGHYDFGILSVTGGEPLLSRATLPVINLVAERFRVSITTNLGANVFGMVRDLRQPRGGSTGLQAIVASLHLTAKGFDRDVFLAKVLYLNRNGIPTTINFVGHPLQLFLADEFQQWCKNHNVPFVLSPWYGRDNDGYEAVYTEAERSYLDAIAPANRKSGTQIDFSLYHYLLEMDAPRVRARLGESIAIKGTIRNTGNGSWSTTAADSLRSFAIGARLYAVGEARRSLRDFKCPLSRSEVLPQEECEVEIDCATHGLPRGVYTLKVGLIREDEVFWFQNKGHEPATVDIELGLREYPQDARVSCEILDAAVSEECEQDAICTARVRVRHTGSVEWFSEKYDEEIRLGCRIYAEVFTFTDIALRDVRAYPAASIMPGETLEADMTLDFTSIPQGRYSLVFDMVNEKKYWFRDKGSKPLVRRIRIV